MRIYIFSILFIYLGFQAVYSQTITSGLEVPNYQELNLDVNIKGESDLNKNRIKNRAELKLLQAGIGVRDKNAPNIFLAIEVTFVGQAFSINVGLNRVVKYSVKNKEYEKIGTTWRELMIGTYGDDVSNVFDTLDEILDKFLLQYFKANQK
jgi:hypothetical protein